MNYKVSANLCVHRGKAALVFVIGTALLLTVGCDSGSPAAHDAKDVSAGLNPDGNSPIEVPGAPATDPSALAYVSSADSGHAAVSGTSTLHDWTVKSSSIKGDAEFSGEWKSDSASAIKLQGIDLVVPVDSLKSTEGGGMDKNMYDALKLKQFPAIAYHLTKATLKTSPSKPGLAYHFDTVGQLTVAGGKHEVNMDMGILPHDDGRLTITADVGLKMTDFGIKPPTAMFGAIKSGDAITVKANWELTPRPPAAESK